MTRGRPPIRGLVAAILATLTLVGSANAARPSGSSTGNAVAAILGTTTAASSGVDANGVAKTRMTSDEVTRIAKTSARARAWIRDHPTVRTSARSDPKKREWTVSFVSAANRTEAQVIVSDRTGTISETRTGPQVAWSMARGYPGAFGRSITKRQIWIPLFVMFLVPLIRWRRPLSWHTLDLVALCGFAASLVWFNRGEIFTSVPLAYPPLAYLAIRLLAIGLHRPRRRNLDDDVGSVGITGGPRVVSVFPTWLMFAVMLLALGLRVGLNAFDANVIDVGYAGVIGADRISHGVAPYGTFPSDCSQCDTYGPVNYLAYVPFEAVAPWAHRWNDLPAAHLAAVAFDLATIAGLMLLGWRLGGRRLAVGLGLAWTAYPFSAYVLESNSNDSLPAALLTWGLVVAHRPVGRGVMAGLAALAKFTPAILLLLWARHPFPLARPRRRVPWYVLGLVVATLLCGWVVLLDGAEGARRFYDRTLGFQFGRESPFSIWGQHPGLRPVQLSLAALVVVAAVAFTRWPRHLDLRRFAALSGVLMLGIQLTLTHWFYLYIPWFLPFALVAMVPSWPPPAEPRRQDPPSPAAHDDWTSRWFAEPGPA